MIRRPLLRSLTLSIILSAVGTMNAQTLITVDMGANAKLDLSALDSLDDGDQYQVKVIGVNLNLYKVVVNGRDSSTAKPLAFPAFGDIAVDAISTLVGGVSLVTSASEPLPFVPVTDTKGQIKMYSNMPALDAVHKYAQSLKGTVKPDPVRDFMRQLLAQRSSNISGLAKDLNGIKQRIDAINLKVQQRSYALRGLEKPIATTNTIDTHLNDIAIIRLELLQKQGEVNALQQELADWGRYQLILDLYSRDKDVKTDADNIGKALEALASNASAQLVSIDPANTSKLLDMLHTLELNAGKDYISMPFQYNGGEGKITIALVPTESGSRLPSYSSAYKFPAPSCTYWGITGGAYAAGLYSEAFSTSTATSIIGGDTLATYSLVDEDVKRYEIGVYSLLTVGWNLGVNSPVGFHFVVGPGVGIAEKVRARMLLGGGFSFGREHSIVVNGGVMAGYVDRRSAAFAKDGPYSAPADKPITVAKLDESWFVSLGYLFKF